MAEPLILTVVGSGVEGLEGFGITRETPCAILTGPIESIREAAALLMQAVRVVPAGGEQLSLFGAG